MKYDIIGDVHGCYDELWELLEKLGYIRDGKFNPLIQRDNRKLVFVGDLIDRGPKNMEVLNFLEPVKSFLCISRGNHDDKLYRFLKGNRVELTDGLFETTEQLEHEDDIFKERLLEWLRFLPYYLILDEGKLVVSHAGILEKYIGQYSRAIQTFCMWNRTNWTESYTGDAYQVYGHTPIVAPKWIGKTINIDTGCVFGGSLTALRYPEMEIVSVKAKERYWPPKPKNTEKYFRTEENFPILDGDF